MVMQGLSPQLVVDGATSAGTYTRHALLYKRTQTWGSVSALILQYSSLQDAAQSKLRLLHACGPRSCVETYMLWVI